MVKLLFFVRVMVSVRVKLRVQPRRVSKYFHVLEN